MKKIFMALMAIAAIALTSCQKENNTPDDPNNNTPAQTEATVTAYYVTSAATLKYCDMAFTADGKEIKGTVKTLSESSMSEALVGNVETLVGSSNMKIDEIRVVEFAAQKLSLGEHKVKTVLSRNATAVEEAEINMAYGWQFSSTDGSITTRAQVQVYVGVDTATGIDGQGDDNILAVINEVGEVGYTVSAKK